MILIVQIFCFIILMMYDKSMKCVHEIDILLKNLPETHNNPLVLQAKVDHLLRKLSDLEEQIKLIRLQHKKQLNKKDEDLKNMKKLHRAVQQKLYIAEQNNKQLQQINKKKSAAISKINERSKQSIKLARMERKKIAAQQKVNQYKKVIVQLETKLHAYSKYQSMTKQEIVEKVFQKLKNMLDKNKEDKFVDQQAFQINKQDAGIKIQQQEDQDDISQIGSESQYQSEVDVDQHLQRHFSQQEQTKAEQQQKPIEQNQQKITILDFISSKNQQSVLELQEKNTSQQCNVKQSWLSKNLFLIFGV